MVRNAITSLSIEKAILCPGGIGVVSFKENRVSTGQLRDANAVVSGSTEGTHAMRSGKAIVRYGIGFNKVDSTAAYHGASKATAIAGFRRTQTQTT